jgi:hypothetical protein
LSLEEIPLHFFYGFVTNAAHWEGIPEGWVAEYIVHHIGMDMVNTLVCYSCRKMVRLLQYYDSGGCQEYDTAWLNEWCCLHIGSWKGCHDTLQLRTYAVGFCYISQTLKEIPKTLFGQKAHSDVLARIMSPSTEY